MKKKLLKSLDIANTLQEEFNKLSNGTGNIQKAESLRKTGIAIVRVYAVTKKEQEVSNSKVSKEIKEFFDIN
jgi:hypothetical protein